MSTRLIVKNLPDYVTPDRLRQHFQQKGSPACTLTDAKVSLKRDGTSRRFGFVGFKTSQEAQKAREWFDKTFIDSTRISVGVVEEKGHEPSPRPNKRPRLGPSPTEVQSSSAKGKSKDQGPSASGSGNKQLEQFMEVMKPRTKKGPSWANEDSVPQPSALPAPAKATSMSAKAKEQDSGDDEDVEMADEDSSALPPASQPLSDMEWLKQRMTSNVDKVVEEKAFEQSDDEDAGKDNQNDEETAVEASNPEEEVKDPIKETILQTARLFVRNLTFSCTEEELEEHFKPFGNITQVHIPIDLNTKQAKGLAYVTFASPTEAVAAYDALDKSSFQGRLLHILGAVDRRGGPNADLEGAEGKTKRVTVKGEKEVKRKAAAGKEFNWSMLYMNSDAVASSIADRMGIPKTAILNPDSSSLEGGATSNPAVKLALAETHIITETKVYLESHGVVLSSFQSNSNSRPRRSDTVILVKNIPYGTTETQIRELFEPHGELVRVLVPPAGTIAVVEYVKAEEAAKGFRSVAYRRMGNSVVYLEKGPVGMFDSSSDGEGGVSEETKEMLEKTVVRVSEGGDKAEPEGVEETGGVGTTLYVKNLSFATTQEKFSSVFASLPSFLFARIQTKPDPKRPNSKLSMGYGFVGFKDPESAKKALKSLQGFVLDGHELNVKFAGRGKEEMEKDALGAEKGTGSKARTTKMIVKNVPFEATKKDIRDLFSAHGKLKSVRLPKKFDSRTRGFAFLEFVTRHEAENAFNALKHTHLLGRHLVLEWAAEDEEQDLDALRKKAGVGFGDGKGNMPGRKRKLDMPGKKGEEDPEDLEG
ncbi:hypothetical protein EST38_g8495 [Candolleomyces aberdarensis]|uniref:RRM domain-containing protein n=1 Tax=Candolleomyces aberdarensis TaxID=2316362 RepID=A0A4Q2DD39_9AGAR|nr:hypothetical protein EST38_g8495 [Candolleomyces aberdarensis]